MKKMLMICGLVVALLGFMTLSAGADFGYDYGRYFICREHNF